MNRTPLFSKLSSPSRTKIESVFERYVKNAKGEPYEKPVAGLTKDLILKSTPLRKFWVYWYKSIHLDYTSEHRLKYMLELSAKSEEFASRRLGALIFVLWKLAQCDENDVETDIRKLSEIRSAQRSDGWENLLNGVAHLQAAAQCFGYESDHFIRSVRVNTIRRLEGETDAQHKFRTSVVEAYKSKGITEYVESENQLPSLPTHALRRIWPILNIDVVTLKLLFLTNNGSHRHAAALRSILTMASPDFSLTTGYIDKFLVAQDSTS